MKKIFSLLALIVFSCMGAWAETTAPLKASTNAATPEYKYTIHPRSNSSYYWSAETKAVNEESNFGKFAFYAVDGVSGAYYIYSVDLQKWVTYTKLDSYTQQNGFVSLSNERGNYFYVERTTSTANNASDDKTGYLIRPYQNSGVASIYLNWLYGADDSRNVGQTMGIYGTGQSDAGSVWVLTADEETKVNFANDWRASLPHGLNGCVGSYTDEQFASAAGVTYDEIATWESNNHPVAFDANKFYVVYNAALGSEYAWSTSGTSGNAHPETLDRDSEHQIFMFEATGTDAKPYFIRSFATKKYFKKPEGATAFALQNSATSGNSFSIQAKEGSSVLYRFSAWNDDNPRGIIWYENANTIYGWTADDKEYFYIEPVSIDKLKELVDFEEWSSRTIGSELGQYHASVGDAAWNNALAAFQEDYIAADIMNAKDVLSTTSLSINLPSAHKFYRFKGQTGRYINSDVVDKNSDDQGLYTMKDLSGNENKTIFYLTDDNHLIAYATGMSFSWGWKSSTLGASHDCTWTISEAEAIGKYIIECPNASTWQSQKYLGDVTNQAYLNRQATKNENTAWTIEEVDELPVALNANSGCASFYAPVAMTVTSGDAYIAVPKDASTITLSPVADNVIPAGSGVILKGNGTATLTLGGEVTETRDNALKGSEYTKVKPTDEGTIYVLVNNNGAPAFQQYSGANVNGFKAYLPIQAGGESNLRVVFDEGFATGVESIKNNVQDEFFDLQGRRVQNAQRGLYIVNGKKVIR